MKIPRAEHPRPQFQRQTWLNLNGDWTYVFDFSQSGKAQGFAEAAGFDAHITVPFCPESRLSGVGFTDFIPAMWYVRKVRIPEGWGGQCIFFHCGGIDYLMELYIDGVLAGSHAGGSSPVELEIGRFVKAGAEHHFVIHVQDDTRSRRQALGKQSISRQSAGCRYTRTTGIWQTVWLEAADRRGLRHCTITPDFDNGAFAFAPEFIEAGRGCTLTIRMLDSGKCAAQETLHAGSGTTALLKLPEPKAWSPEFPFLYDIEFTVRDGEGRVLDCVTSYAGLRKFHVEGDRLYFNNQEIFLRLVLDQGFYPDGIWTAPSDEALRRDIELAMQAGFNGARLHQKVFEERFHYWADKLGYLTWAEFSDWGMGFWRVDNTRAAAAYPALRDYFGQWSSVVARDRNHPSIIAWTPLNETNDPLDLAEHRRFVSDIYDLTKQLDPTRPVNDSSGYIHAKTDLWTVHNYAAAGEKLSEMLKQKPVWMNFPAEEGAAYCGQPLLVDEYGGVRYYLPGSKPYAANSWGYGDLPKSEEEAVGRIAGLTRALLDTPGVRGYCYTQLTDIEQEENGIYTFDRRPKFNMEAIRAIFSGKPEP